MKRIVASIITELPGRLSRRALVFIALALISLFLTMILGSSLYNLYRLNARACMEKDLRIIARDWYKFTRSQVLHLERLMRREEALVEQRLHEQLLLTKVLLEHADSKTKYPKLLKRFYDDRRITFLMMNKVGQIVLSDEDGLIGRSLIKSSDSVENSVLEDYWPEFLKLKEDKVYTVHLKWQIGNDRNRLALMVFTYSRKLRCVLALRLFYQDYKSFDLERTLKNEIRDAISEEVIGQKGYIWVLNSQGEYVVSRERVRDNENVYDDQDPQGRYSIRAILDKAHRLRGEETAVHYYWWRNIGEEKFYRKVAAFTYVPEWDWIIGASSYQDDFLVYLGKTRMKVFQIGMIVLGLVLLLTYALISLLPKPYRRMRRWALQVADENQKEDEL